MAMEPMMPDARLVAAGPFLIEQDYSAYTEEQHEISAPLATTRAVGVP
jgi:hypothetical protein